MGDIAKILHDGEIWIGTANIPLSANELNVSQEELVQILRQRHHQQNGHLTKVFQSSSAIFISFPYICRPKFKKNMANHKATKKDVRQSAKRRERNRYYGKTTRNAIRELRGVNEAAAAGEQLPEVASMIDKLAKRGVIHKNKAANLKSKLARRVNKLAK
jgi:small subunit ribosomal protein S20